MSFDLADYAVEIAQKEGASYCDARYEKTSASSFLLKNGQPEISGFDLTTGIGVRMLVSGSLGFVSTNNISKKKIKDMITSMIHALHSRPALLNKIALSSEKSHVAKVKVKQKRPIASVSSEDKLDYLMQAEQAIRDSGVECPGRYLSLSDSDTVEYIVTSEGTRIQSQIPRIGFMYYLTIAGKGKTMQRYWQFGNSGGYEFVDAWDIPSLLNREVTTCQEMLLKGKRPPKGKLDLIAGPQVTGIMVHESAGHPCEADRIFGREAAQAGESFITPSKIGERIGSDCVTIADNPLVENSYGYYVYDNEGVKARKKLIIKDGIINEFLHDRASAAMMGISSNGSSRAVDFDKESIVRMSNTYMVPGKQSEEELIEGVKKGVLMRNFTEWNIDDRRMNQRYVGAEAYLIENGEIAGPVFHPKFEIQTPTLYASIDAVGNNLEHHAGTCGKGEPMQGMPVWLGGPSIRIRGVRLG